MVVAPASEGYVGILPHHVPLFTTLGPGEFKVKKGGVEEVLAVFGGFMEVGGDRVVVLTDAAGPAEEMDQRPPDEGRGPGHQGPASRASARGAGEQHRAKIQRIRVLQT